MTGIVRSHPQLLPQQTQLSGPARDETARVEDLGDFRPGLALLLHRDAVNFPAAYHREVADRPVAEGRAVHDVDQQRLVRLAEVDVAKPRRALHSAIVQRACRRIAHG